LNAKDRTELASLALEKSLETRDEHGYDYRSPLNPFDLAERAGVKVQFVDDVSMEGVYAALQKPTILISSLRPLARRAYTCAHELGHHFFKHGSTIDELREDDSQARLQPNEFLAETFAGYLLMPAQGIRRAFTSLGTSPDKASPEEVFAVSVNFGVGYETLISHLAHSLKLVSQHHASELSSVKLNQVRKSILGYATKDSLVVANSNYLSETLDVEVGTLVLLPASTTCDMPALLAVEREVPAGRIFRAAKPGLARVSLPSNNLGLIVRISKHQYAGLARYRHLEDDDDG
jgi:Zn-dependent peptidase ImmA (M78 family)